MNVGKAIRLRLVADEAITELVGGRVFADAIPQGESRPAITYSLIDGSHGETLDGPDGLADVTIEVTSWAMTSEAAHTIKNEVRRSLHGFRGTMHGVRIQGIFNPGDTDVTYPPVDGSDRLSWGMQTTFMVIYEEGE